MVGESQNFDAKVGRIRQTETGEDFKTGSLVLLKKSVEINGKEMTEVVVGEIVPKEDGTLTIWFCLDTFFRHCVPGSLGDIEKVQSL